MRTNLSCCDSVEVFTTQRAQTRQFARSQPAPKRCPAHQRIGTITTLPAPVPPSYPNYAPPLPVVEPVPQPVVKPETIKLKLGKVRIEVKNAHNVRVKEGEDGELIIGVKG